jgi:predicted glycogen debranching enzyme
MSRAAPADRARSAGNERGSSAVSIGSGVLGELEPAVRREWLVTNGIGGYAAGTLAGIPTRVYHGLLVASLRPPVDRRLAVGGLIEWATVGERRVALHAYEYADGSIDQRGFETLASFELDGARPVWTFAIGDVRLEKRVWMAHGRNTTYVRYALAPGSVRRAVALELTPLVSWRDHHAAGSAFEPRPQVQPTDDGSTQLGLAIRFPDAPVELRMLWDGGSAAAETDWYYGLRHREEAARGLPDRSDLLAAGRFVGTIGPGEPLTLTFTTEVAPPSSAEEALHAAIERERKLIALAGSPASPVVSALVLASDAFIVSRRIPAAGGLDREGRSIIAGYPWFNDWGRDTMIALPGLCLATGRHDEARTILSSFAGFVVDGLLPNNFPDSAGEEPGRNTVDASLWYPLAVAAYVDATGDLTLVDELLPTFSDILDCHLAGTRYGIGADRDGLLRAGEPGQQLTWMDARVGDREITPRIGKPVEIQALWVNALLAVGEWCRARDGAAAARYLEVAERARVAFVARFWRPELGYLADVVDGPDVDDDSLRPNQLFALSLREPLVDESIARSVLDTVGRELETPVGLRSLGPTDPRYARRYGGGPASRDTVYHQGTAWAWLAGAYADALVRFGGDEGVDRARAMLDGLRRQLVDAGLGSVSEIFDADPPFTPRGCPWQAWSVAEFLRAWRSVTGE